MKNITWKIKWLTNLSYVFVGLYFIISFYFFFFREMVGDEFFFVEELSKIQTTDLNYFWLKDVCIPLIILSTPFTLFFTKIMAIRVLNLILMTFYLFITIGTLKRLKIQYLFHCLFYFATVGFFFSATNDALFSLSLALFFILIQCLLENGKKYVGLTAFSLILAIFTRYIIIIFLPVIIFFLYRQYQENKEGLRRLYKIFLILLIPFLTINMGSVVDRGKISYTVKDRLQDQHGVTWAQRQYLSQILVNAGKLEFAQHPSWEETRKYLEENGSDALPKSSVTSWLFDLELTFKEFFKDFSLTIFYAFRQIGIVIILILFLPFYNWLKKKNLSESAIPLSIIYLIAVFSFIIISNVELRWLSSGFLLAIWYYSKLLSKINGSKVFQTINSSIFILLSLYGSYGLILRIS